MSEHVLLQGDCLEVLKDLPDNSIDSLITDPPAGISFMGKSWDEDKGGRKQWIAWMSSVMVECKRVLKPGAHGLVWAISRTSHWTATALEDAGFEIRDVVTHLFGSGFPKSLDISKAIDKAAGAEREVVGEKTFADGSKARKTQNLGGNSFKDPESRESNLVITAPSTPEAKEWQGWGTALKPASEHWILIRKPCSEKTVAANALKHGCGGINIDASRIGFQSEIDKASAKPQGAATSKQPKDGLAKAAGINSERIGFEANQSSLGRFPSNLILSEDAPGMLDEQSEGASRFFYCAKASKKDKGTENTHPTVKSTALMSYLIKLITPTNGIVLDPFLGSGTTGVSALTDGFDFIGIEKELEYFKIAEARLDNVKSKKEKAA